MQVDVIAIGGGLSGLVVAARAAQHGLKTVVLEQETAERYLCSSRYATGVFGVMQEPTLAAPEDLERAIINDTDGTARPELAKAVASNVKRAVGWLKSEGARFIETPTRQGKKLMLAPPRRFKEGLDWEGRGADVLLRTLERNLNARGGQILRGVTAESLVIEGRRCAGVEAKKDGKAVRFTARAVVIADGGFQANPDMVRKYISPHPERILLRAAPTGRGDGIRMAAEAGAAIGGFGKFYGHLHHRDTMTNNRLWPYPHFDALAEVSILVGPGGRRFTDEGLGGVAMTNAIAGLEDPLSATIIFDDAMWTGGPGTKGLPVPANPFLMTGGGWMHSAPDLTSLADKTNLPAPALRETVERYNSAVARRNFSTLDPARTTRSFTPLPIATAPFHAVPLCAGLTLTMGGIAVNSEMQALRPDGSAIEGLYVSGTPVAGLEGGPRAGYVGGLCKAFVLGLIAADHIASVARS